MSLLIMAICHMCLFAHVGSSQKQSNQVWSTLQADFDSELDTAKKLKDDLVSKRDSLGDQIANRNGDKAEEKKDGDAWGTMSHC